MGWCSATGIIDAAIDMADTIATHAVPLDLPPDRQRAIQVRVDRAMREQVRAIAKWLRDEDWDCIDESDHYNRFGPEMHGMTDQEYRAYMAEQLDPETFATWLNEVWLPQGREPRAGTDG